MDDDLTRLTGEESKENLLSEGQAFGHYKVIRLLGRGGMGEVYEVKHTVLHRKYALKVIRRELFRQTSASERFRREAQVMNHLEHPHIVPVDDYGETDGHTWLRMPLLGGYKSGDGGRLLHSLGDRMRGREPIPEKEVGAYLEAILSGLSYAHGKGAIHRDIKPSNILFDGEGGLKIADFGLVSVAGEDWLQSRVQLSVARSQMDTDKTRLVGEGSGSEGSSTQALLGTFEYMSPEQKRGEEADARSDLYAVGLIAFRMLTGAMVPGFKAPSRMNAEISSEWDGWLERAMEERAALRFLSAREMLEALPEVVGSGGKGETGASGRGGESSVSGKTGAVRGKKRRIEKEGRPEGTETKVESGSSVKSGRKGVWMILLLLAGALGYYLGVVVPEPEKAAAAEEPELSLRAVPDEYTVPEEGEGYVLDLGGGEKLELVWIEPGSFMMGSPESEEGRFSSEKQHQVRLSEGYWLGETEVTQGQWSALMGSNPSRFKGSDRPVEEVSWEDAMEFCRKLTARERAAGRLPKGYVYNLPSEAQWEYACRAGTSGPYAGSLDTMAWYEDNSGSETHAVGRKRANGWGLYDMHGNVWEWCLDRYGSYPGGSVVDPAGASEGSLRVYRGGSWYYIARRCRSAFRSRNGPGYRSDYLGFRLALSVNR